MAQIVIDIPDDVAERVSAVAAARGVPVAEIAGEAVAEKFPPRRRVGFASLGRSTNGRSAAEDEDMLAEGFGR